MDQAGPIRPPSASRAIVAVLLLLGMFCGMTLAASPRLHELLHSPSSELSDDHCAAALLLSGSVSLALETPNLPALSEAGAAPEAVFAPNSPMVPNRSLNLPARAPPLRSPTERPPSRVPSSFTSFSKLLSEQI